MGTTTIVVLPNLLTSLGNPPSKTYLSGGRVVAKRHLNMTENADYNFSGLFYQLLRFPLFSKYLDEELLKQGVSSSRAMRKPCPIFSTAG
jgi:DNA helicase-2/ATP-dependent DNA helicase PcrA